LVRKLLQVENQQEFFDSLLSFVKKNIKFIPLKLNQEI